MLSFAATAFVGSSSTRQGINFIDDAGGNLMTTDLAKLSARWVDWFKDSALPLWSGAAINPESGASYERFLASGEVDKAANIRLRVQARQIFVFSVASERGWMAGGEPVVSAMADFVERIGVHESGEGYIHLLSPSYEVLDSKQDLYDHAFALLACALRYRVFKEDSALARADKLIAMLDSRFGGVGGGWLEGDYATDRRRQNPHMHLFEAFLALYDATGEAKWLARAGEMFALFETRFYDGKYGVLREYFNEDWSLLDGADGEIVEPGHMMEWVWLLHWYGKRSGRDTSGYADTLYETALASGLTPEGLLYDEVSPEGKVLKGSKRCWPMTELIKASIAQARVGRAGAEAQAAKAVEVLLDRYLSCAKRDGTYIDQLDSNNEVLVDFAPASTLYHLIVAAMEVADYVKESEA